MTRIAVQTPGIQRHVHTMMITIDNDVQQLTIDTENEDRKLPS